MSFSLRKFARPFRKYLSRAAAAFTGEKMVRFFQNSYEDYKPEKSAAPNVGEVCRQINEHLQSINMKLPPSPQFVDGGLYVGVTGIAYMYYQLAKNPEFAESREHFLDKGIEYIHTALTHPTGEPTSFLLGHAGTLAVAAALFKEKNESDKSYMDLVTNYKDLHPHYLKINFLKCGGDEFFVGRAGYLAGALWLRRELGSATYTDKDLQNLYNICDVIVESGKSFSKQQKSRCPLLYHYYNTEYLGAAHGISTILQMLLSVPGYIKYNKTAAQDIEAATRYICSLQTNEGNWPCCMEEIGIKDHQLIHWCHGAPGTIYLMAKAYFVFKDDIFLKSALKAGDMIWNKGLLRKGPGICHGVAGNGYVFLLLYRMTQDDKYLYRAKKFADFMSSPEFIQEASVPNNPESLYEGVAGTVCFLADLLVPDRAEFPFQDVFSA